MKVNRAAGGPVKPLGGSLLWMGIPAWIAAWILPWPIWLSSLPWLRVLLGLVLLVVPGMACSLLLIGTRFNLAEHILGGLSLSVLLLALLGLIGRAANLPFSFVNASFRAAGLIGVGALAVEAAHGRGLFKPRTYSTASLLLLLGMTVFGGLLTYWKPFGGDDFSYLAYLTNWQHADPLNFREVIFGTGSIDDVRFWLNVFPMSLAFLSDASHLHGLLLIGYYLEPLLMPCAIFAAFDLFEDLTGSETLAVTATLVSLTLFYPLLDIRQPGYAFYYRLSEDKAFAAFVIAPVLFIALRRFLESRSVRSGVYLLLLGWALAFTHAVILAFAIFIAGIYATYAAVGSKEFRTLGVCALILLGAILPLAPLRYVNVASSPKGWSLQSALAEDSNVAGTRITYLPGTPFYGMELDTIQMGRSGTDGPSPSGSFLSWSYLWILGVGFVWSLSNLRRNTAAPFIAAACLLVWISIIPYTGWLVGYFVTARMLWRTPWLLPMGLIGVIMLFECIKLAFRAAPRFHPTPKLLERMTAAVGVAVCLAPIAYASLRQYPQEWATIAELGTYRERLEALAGLGDYLQANLAGPAMFYAPPALIDYVPGLSSKSKVIYFRDIYSKPYTVDPVEIDLISSPAAAVTSAERMNLLDRYGIEYILTEDPAVERYYAGLPQAFSSREDHGFWIIRYLGASNLGN